MTQPTVSFAILGAGMVAHYHQTAILENADRGARLVAIGHYDPARFGAIRDEFGAPIQTYDEILARDDVDVVAICTPSGQHAAQAVAAARAGKHVMVEKPMALAMDDVQRMMRACDEAGVLLGVTMQRRVDPLFQRVHEAIEAGDLGELTLGVLTLPYKRDQAYYDQADWRGTWALDGGGVLMNQGIHIIDLLVWFMGDPVAVQATAGTHHHNIEVEDVVAATLEFENGARASITATTSAAPGFPHRLEIYGTRGAIQIEGESVRRWTLVDPSKAKVEPIQPIEGEEEAGSAGDPKGIKPSGHIALVRDFLDALQHDRAPKIDGVQGQRSLRTILKIYEAAGILPKES